MFGHTMKNKMQNKLLSFKDFFIIIYFKLFL